MHPTGSSQRQQFRFYGTEGENEFDKSQTVCKLCNVMMPLWHPELEGKTETSPASPCQWTIMTTLTKLPIRKSETGIFIAMELDSEILSEIHFNICVYVYLVYVYICMYTHITMCVCACVFSVFRVFQPSLTLSSKQFLHLLSTAMDKGHPCLPIRLNWIENKSVGLLKERNICRF